MSKQNSIGLFSIVICSGLVFLLGCSKPADANLTIWRSRHATPEERAKAVNQMIPPGTLGRDAEKILGKRGNWVRYQGAVLDLSGGTPEKRPISGNPATHPEWQLQYNVAGGKVILMFQSDAKKPPTDAPFLRAAAAKDLIIKPDSPQSPIP
jgi:hypothetical protein